MSETKHRIIAVDFDGCLCENRWPDIGDDNPEVVRAVLEEQAAGSKIILWTCRTGELLDNALAWCQTRGIRFDAVNEHLPELKEIYGNDNRKIFATEYWDDRAVRMPALRPLNKLAMDIHQNAVAHGWWDEPRSFGDIVALCHSELSEALEEFRGADPWCTAAAATASLTSPATGRTRTRPNASRRASRWRCWTALSASSTGAPRRVWMWTAC